MFHFLRKLRDALQKGFVLLLARLEFHDVHRFDGVVEVGKQLLETRELARELAGFLGHFLRVFHVVPEPVRILHRLELRNTCAHFLGVYPLICGV